MTGGCLQHGSGVFAGGQLQKEESAQRQEMIYWLSLVLNIEPAVQLQEVLNYTDWRSVDP